jgi:hypothetical protein
MRHYVIYLDNIPMATTLADSDYHAIDIGWSLKFNRKYNRKQITARLPKIKKLCKQPMEH